MVAADATPRLFGASGLPAPSGTTGMALQPKTRYFTGIVGLSVRHTDLPGMRLVLKRQA